MVVVWLGGVAFDGWRNRNVFDAVGEADHSKPCPPLPRRVYFLSNPLGFERSQPLFVLGAVPKPQPLEHGDRIDQDGTGLCAMVGEGRVGHGRLSTLLGGWGSQDHPYH